MSSVYRKKLLTLSGWLRKEGFLEESLLAGLLKTAISKEEAENTLNTSKRVPKILKSILWEKGVEYDSRGLDYLAKIYRQQVLDLIPGDIEDKDKGLAIQWLGSLGSYDKDFAKKLILNAADEDSAVIANYFMQTVVLRMREDYDPDGVALSSVKNKLERFFLWKKFMPEKDLMSIRSLKQLNDVIQSSEGAIKEYEENKKYLNAEEGKELLGEDSFWKAIAIHNKGAACELGKNTEWCTAAPGGSAFAQYYHPQDPLFFIENVNPASREFGERYQIHFGSNQFMDKEDMPVGGHLRDELIEALVGFGADKYLSARVYSNYESFYDLSYDEEDFLGFANDLDTYNREVISQKIKDDSFNDTDNSSFNKFIDQISEQIANEQIPLDDSKMSDRAVQLLADYSPTQFFLEKLHIDYPELARKAFMNSIYPNRNENLYTKTHHPLSIGSAVLSGLLFESESISEALEDEGVRKAFVINLLNSKPIDLISPHKMDQQVRAIIEEVVPGFIRGYIESAYAYPGWSWYVGFKNKAEIELSDDLNLEYFKDEAAGPLDVRKHIVDIEIRYPLNTLIAKNFHKNYPLVFKKTLSSLIKQLLSKELDSWTYITAIKDMAKLGVLSDYSKEILEIFRAGFSSSDHKRFGRGVDDLIKDLNLSEDMLLKIREMRQSADVNYNKRLFEELDSKFLSWRNEDMSSVVLNEVDAAIRGLNTSGPNKLFFTNLHNKVIDAVRSAQSAAHVDNSNLRTKPEMGEDVLLYLATFEPRTWDNLNLDYRSVGVTDSMRAKAKRGLSALSFNQDSSYSEYDEDEQ